MTHPLAALIAGVKVKPLVWAEDFADHPFGWYETIDCGDCIVLTQSGVSVGSFHTLEAAKAAAQADYESRILAALEAATPPDLTDSVTVHANMLRGTIAKPTVDQIIHLYGREAFQPMIGAAVAKALEDACLAVSEHADWPEDEHGRTEQARLFARVINAICAIAPAAPHVKETPKSEHDADVLTVPDLVEAGKYSEILLGYSQGDMEGVMALISRQALHEAADTIRALVALATAQAAQIAGLREANEKMGQLSLDDLGRAQEADMRREAAEAEAAALLAGVPLLIDKALLPCPFCGGDAEFSIGKTGDGKDWNYVECVECEAMGPRVQYADHNIAIKDALAAAWNRRAIPATDAREAALREAAAIATRHISRVQVNEPIWHEGQDWAAQRISEAILALIVEPRT